MDSNLAFAILIFNVILMICGAALIGVGGLALINQPGLLWSLEQHDWISSTEDGVERRRLASTATTAIIATCVISGVALVISGAIGVVGVKMKWSKVVAGIATLYLIFSCIMAVFGVVILLEVPQVEDLILSRLEHLVDKVNGRGLEPPEEFYVSEAQKAFDCCVSAETAKFPLPACVDGRMLCKDVIDFDYTTSSVAITSLVAVFLMMLTASISIISISQSVFV